MNRPAVLLACVFMSSVAALGQTPGNQPAGDTGFKISLPSHPGQLKWHADGFKIIDNSAKSQGQEIGLRGKDGTGSLGFLGFLFLVPGHAPLSSVKCRAEAMVEEKNNPTLKLLATSHVEGSENIPVALATYSNQGPDGKKWYSVRGFVGKADMCGDLQFWARCVPPARQTCFRSCCSSRGLARS